MEWKAMLCLNSCCTELASLVIMIIMIKIISSIIIIIIIIITITRTEEQRSRPFLLQTKETKRIQKSLGFLQNLKVRKNARKDPGPKYCLIRLTCYLLKIMSLYPSFQSPSKRIIISGLSTITCLSFYLSRSVSLSLCFSIYLSTSLFINLSIF